MSPVEERGHGITYIRDELGHILGRSDEWTEDENKLLIEHYPSSPKKDLLKKLPNRNWDTIRVQANKLNLYRRIYDLNDKSDAPPLENLSEREIGYISGFLDSDGSIQLNRGKYRYGDKTYHRLQPCVSFYNTNLGVLKWIQSKIGGKVYSRMNKHRYSLNVKRIHKLWIGGVATVFNLLKVIAPTLKVKKQRADLVMEFCQSRLSCSNPRETSYTKRDWKIYEEMRCLNNT